MHEVLVNRLGGLSLPRKSVVRLTDRPDMTLDVYCGRKTTKQNKKKKSGYKFKRINSVIFCSPEHAQGELLGFCDVCCVGGCLRCLSVFVCVHSGGHSFKSIFLKLCQNVYLHLI